MTPHPFLIMEPGQLDQIVLLLIRGSTAEHAESQCCIQFGMSLTDAKAAVVEARQVITLAADFHRDGQFGLAIRRLNDLYQSCLDDEEHAAVLAAQKELSRMMGLHGKMPSADGRVGFDAD